MNQTNHLEVGKKGEEIAKEYLEGKGYEIIEKNYRTRFAEIDLIAKKDNELVFIEVRTKIGGNFGTPEDTINSQKMRKVLWNAKNYAGFKKWKGLFRIDAVCIVLKNNHEVERISHYENIASS